MSEKGRQVIIELLVYNFEVVFKVCTEVFNVEKYFLKVLFDYCENTCKFYVTKPGHNVIGNCVVLISYQYWEFYVKALHKLGGPPTTGVVSFT